MVIACYAGVGKSTFAKKFPDETIDLCSMPFSWILPGRSSEGEFEDVKAALYLLRNPSFPDNYITAILEEEQKHKYVLIPTINTVMERLYEEYKIPYIVCYPQMDLKKEYERRYMARGNTGDFLEIFIGQWEDRIQSLVKDRNGTHIRLRRGKFLTDVKDELDRIIESVGARSEENIQRSMEINQLKKKVDAIMAQGCLSFIRHDDLKCSIQYCYFPIDLREPENRKWVFELGKKLYDDDIRIDVDKVQDMEAFYQHWYNSDPSKVRRFDSKQELMDYLDRL